MVGLLVRIRGYL